MKRALFCGLAIFILYLPALAQQTDINRYTLFTGFDYMISPARNLTARGFEGDFAVVDHLSSKGDGHFSVLFTGRPHGDFHVLPERGKELH